MGDFFDFYFYWLGVATAVLFALIGYCVVVAAVLNIAWAKFRDVHSMIELLWISREYTAKHPEKP